MNLPEISYTLHPATAGAYAANGIGTRNVAKCAAEVGAPVAFISTDYVFGGEKKSAYWESDATSPLNVFLFPTPTHQVAQQLVRLSRAEAYGLYHATVLDNKALRDASLNVFTDWRIVTQLSWSQSHPCV